MSQKMINLYYWRTNTGAEVDLIIEQSGKLTGAYEIKWSKTPHSAANLIKILSGRHYWMCSCHVVW